MATTDLERINPAASLEQPAQRNVLNLQVTPEQARDMVRHKLEVIQAVLKEGKDGDYWKIPGTGNKFTLLKPGAEKLLAFYGLTHRFEYVKDGDVDGDWEVTVKCSVVDPRTNAVLGESFGYCSNTEKGRSGPKWSGNRNTILKMAQKRALVSASIQATASSDVLAADLDDFQTPSAPQTPAAPAKQPRSEAKWAAVKALAAQVKEKKGNEPATTAWRFGIQRAREQGLGIEDQSVFTLTDEGCDVLAESLRALLDPELPAETPHNPDDDIQFGEVVS